jgi:hypothetical protein
MKKLAFALLQLIVFTFIACTNSQNVASGGGTDVANAITIGTIQDSLGRPVVGARVMIASNHYNSFKGALDSSTISLSDTTDSLGKYQFRIPFNGTYVISAKKRDLMNFSFSIPLGVEMDNKIAPLSLRKTGCVRITLPASLRKTDDLYVYIPGTDFFQEISKPEDGDSTVFVENLPGGLSANIRFALKKESNEKYEYSKEIQVVEDDTTEIH